VFLQKASAMKLAHVEAVGGELFYSQSITE
jgi:hypothetical protein